MIQAKSDRYENAKTRTEKGDTISQVYSTISDRGGRFLIRDEKSYSWLQLDELRSKKKISQSLRDFKKKTTNNASVCATSTKKSDTTLVLSPSSRGQQTNESSVSLLSCITDTSNYHPDTTRTASSTSNGRLLADEKDNDTIDDLVPIVTLGQDYSLFQSNSLDRKRSSSLPMMKHIGYIEASGAVRGSARRRHSPNDSSGVLQGYYSNMPFPSPILDEDLELQHPRTSMSMPSSSFLLDEDLTSMAFDHAATKMRSNLTSSPATSPEDLVLLRQHHIHHQTAEHHRAFMTFFKEPQVFRNESVVAAPIQRMLRHGHHYHLNQTPQLFRLIPRKSSERNEDYRRPAVLPLEIEPLEFGQFEPLLTIGARVPMLRRHSLEGDCDYSFVEKMGAVAKQEEDYMSL